MPRQLCTGKEFRKLVAGGDGRKNLIETHYKPYGIPQGAPISDLLANIYLFYFDCAVAEWIGERGGAYFRYSDDILIVVPGGRAEGLETMARVRALISNYGSKLVIKESKSSVFEFKSLQGDNQTFVKVFGSEGRNGLEYLGFRYDGEHIYLRDSTLSNLYRKIARAARYAANSLARRFPNKDADELAYQFDYETLVQKFGRVRNFNEKDKDYKNWTFWTYVRRTSEILGPLGRPIHYQLKNHRSIIRKRADQELQDAVDRRNKRKSASVLSKTHAEHIAVISP